MRFWIPKRKPEEEPFLSDHRQPVFTRPCGSRQAASMADLIIFEERREREEKRRRRVRFLGALCGSLLLPFLSGSGIYFFVGLILIPAIYLSCTFIEARLSNQTQQANCRSKSNELFSSIRYTIPTASGDLGEVRRRPRALPLGVLLSRRGKSWGCGFESRSGREAG